MKARSIDASLIISHANFKLKSRRRPVATGLFRRLHERRYSIEWGQFVSGLRHRITAIATINGHSVAGKI